MKKGGAIPSDTRYVPLTQQAYCCVPTCIQMIMLRHGIPLVPAELMGKHMKIVVPKKWARLFWNVETSSKRPSGGYGTRLNENLTAGPMFKKLKIPLRMKWMLIDTFDSTNALEKYLAKMVKEDCDVIICYDYGILFPRDGTDRHGHACVLDHVYPQRKEVRFVDPGAKRPKWRTVSIARLFKAMEAHGAENMGGCWEIRKIGKERS